MTVEPRKKTFGSYLAFHRYQTRYETGKHLSQDKFADEMNLLDPTLAFNNDTVYKWEKDIRKFHPEDRSTLITILKVLVKFDGIKSIAEANNLVNLSGLKALDEKEIASLPFPALNLIPVRRDSIAPESPPQSKNFGGGYKRGVDPMNFSRVDSFYRNPVRSDNDLIEASDRSNNQFVNSAVMEKQTEYQAEQVDPAIIPLIFPNLFVGREEALVELRQRFCRDNVGQNNLQVLTAVQDSPGIGKTALASALAQDERIKQQFPDGILWAFLGPQPESLPLLVNWGKSLGVENICAAKSPAEASSILAAFLKDKQVLLIIDDVCNAADAFSFMVGGPRCAELAITRVPSVAMELADFPDQIYYLDKLNKQAAFTILQTLAPDVTEKYPREIHDLIEKLEGLPLALQLAGRMLQVEFNLGFNIANLINEIGQPSLPGQVNTSSQEKENFLLPSFSSLLYHSLDHLDEAEQKYFALLGAFAPSPAIFDEHVVASLWHTDNPQPILNKLTDLGLLDYLPQHQLYQLHALQLKLARSLWKDKFSRG